MKASTGKKSAKPVSRLSITFPQAKARIVDKIELIADGDHHGIVIRFQDNTDLEVRIDPMLEFKARLYDWKNGSQREIKRWPTVRGNIG
jgi:hypothetical protein